MALSYDKVRRGNPEDWEYSKRVYGWLYLGDVTLYVDPDNGTLIHDVFKYEASG